MYSTERIEPKLYPQQQPMELAPPHPTMGRAVSVHRGRIGAGGIWIYFTLIGLVGTANAARAALSSVDGLGVFGAMLLITSLLAFICIARWKQQLTVFEGGFVWRRPFGMVTVPWHEITRVSTMTTVGRMGTVYAATITLRSGKEIAPTDAMENIQYLPGFITSKVPGVRLG